MLNVTKVLKIQTFQKLHQHICNIRLVSSSHILYDNMRIGTHDGVFHCDEVFACTMLKMLPDYALAEIVRTRNTDVLDRCNIVVDVGGVFSHENKRYDHHQKEFQETLSSLRPDVGDKFNIKLSSAGLIYAFYGETIISQLNNNIGRKGISVIFRKVYEHFVQEIDAIDNGVPMTDGEPKYHIHTNLSKRVGRLNPEWNSRKRHDMDEIFNKAMYLVLEEFLNCVNYFGDVWYPARGHVQKALDERFVVHPSGNILLFKERFPWKEHLFDLEEECGLEGIVKYVIFNDKPNSWRVQAVPVSYASFVLRKPLNPKWWGVRDDLLSSIANISGCIFCHANGFIGGNVSQIGALQMAVSSLEADSG